MEYGKFASAEELLKGYNELEKSFTQKCQQLALAEKEKAGLAEQLLLQNSSGTSAEASPQGDVQSTTVEAATVPQAELQDAVQAGLDGAATSPKTPSEENLQQYLKDNPEIALKILQNNAAECAPNVMSGGGNVSLALPSRPKTIKEASVMAKQLFAEN